MIETADEGTVLRVLDGRGLMVYADVERLTRFLSGPVERVDVLGALQRLCDRRLAECVPFDYPRPVDKYRITLAGTKRAGEVRREYMQTIITNNRSRGRK